MQFAPEQPLEKLSSLDKEACLEEQLKNHPLTREAIEFIREYLLTKKKLSKREAEVVIFVLLGNTNLQVAKILDIAEKTIKFHLTNIYKRLSLCRRTQIVWSLPLARIVEINRKSRENPATATSVEESIEELIPIGSSTVNDQIG